MGGGNLTVGGAQPAVDVAADPLAATFAGANPFAAGGRGADTVTIGVAVPIPEPFGTELQKWRESFQDPMALAIPTHVTLLPPSEIEREDLPGVEDHLAKAAAAGRPFTMLLQGTGTFRPISPVTFVQVAQGAQECAATEALVRSGVLAREARFPYHPHVTVAHELPEDLLSHAQDMLAGYEARFPVTGFALYLHGDDGVWRVRRLFPYGG